MLVIAGLAVPVVLQGASHRERFAEYKQENPKRAGRVKDYSSTLAQLYMLIVYGLGFFFSMLPEIYRTQIRGTGEKEFIQAASLPNGFKLICGLQTPE